MEHDELVSSFVEVTLPSEDDFLKVRETLERIGVASRKEQKLYPSCHILHRRGKYYIVHFKEMFALDGRSTDYSDDDRARRNTIANLLAEWGLVKLTDPSKSSEPVVKPWTIKVLSFKDKADWEIVPKYRIGKKTQQSE